MRRLSSEQFSNARNFLLTRARPLDRAMFQFEFEQGSPYAVLGVLSTFQNDDGGFGHALEPDFRLPFSSTIATTVALQYISRLHLEEVPAMAVQALQYLHGSFDLEHQLWESVPESVAEFPRAVWWEYPEPRKADEHWENPGAEILGYLYEFPTVMPSEWQDSLLIKAFGRLDNRANPLEMHDLLCCLRLAERLPIAPQTKLYAMLDSHVSKAVATAPEQWGDYGLQPIQVAASSDAHYYPILKSHVDENLDFLIDSQNSDGAWHPTWQWYRYENEWLQAKEEWKGVLALDNLRALRAYGRIDV